MEPEAIFQEDKVTENKEMAGDWIKVEHATPNKPEVCEIAAILDLDIDAVVGKLVRVFVWADQNCNADGVTSVTVMSLIDRETGVKGFAKALSIVGWLEVEDQLMQFVNFDRHNGKSAKQRGLTNRRVKNMRQSKLFCNAESNAEPVTDALPEKRREEKSIKEDIYGRSDLSVQPNQSVPVLEKEFSAGFADFWKCYPKKVKKQEAWKIWGRKKLEAISEQIVLGVRRYQDSEIWEKGMMHDPTTFLNQGMWEDEPVMAVSESPTMDPRGGNGLGELV